MGGTSSYEIDNLSIVSGVPAKLDLKENSATAAFSDAKVTLDAAAGKVNVAYSASLRTVAQLKAAVTCEDTTVTPVVLDADGNVAADDTALATGMKLGLSKNNVVFLSYDLTVADAPAATTTTGQTTGETDPGTTTTASENESPTTGVAFPAAAVALIVLSAGSVLISKKKK